MLGVYVNSSVIYLIWCGADIGSASNAISAQIFKTLQSILNKILSQIKQVVKTSFLYILILFTALSCGKFSHEEFNSEKWKNSELNAEENWSLRWDMMNDLRNQYDLFEHVIKSWTIKKQ